MVVSVANVISPDLHIPRIPADVESAETALGGTRWIGDDSIVFDAQLIALDKDAGFQCDRCSRAKRFERGRT